ncbi:dihydrolipoyl dehydrogenase [Parvularcula oceani]|uniref:dihydrolipoyl dehydrogenase n=1 Tax=Parvularcula oceani TaxID=1247963 RepID=UPI0004E12545|nr:dihydrolipoyl dehydrogenase [Parvularcula oceani]
MRTVDVAIIGAGTAGLQAYAAAALHTENVLLIEQGAYGTTCARRGCMPSKLMIAAADAAHAVRHAEEFGIRGGPAAIDGQAVMARVHRLRDHFVRGVVEDTEAIPQERRLRGRARFREPGILEVDGEPLRARRIVIATGSTARVPDMLGRGAGQRLLTIDDVFEWNDLPESVVVFGAGVIGIEAAQFLARLGVRVCCLSKGGKIAILTDPHVNEAAHAILGAEFHLDTDAEIERVENDGCSVSVTFREDGETRTERFDYALAATGREPALGGLALENSGLKRDRRGVPLSDPATGLCESGEGPGCAPVFIAGDAEGRAPVLPVASDDGRIAGDNAGRWPGVKAHERKVPLFVTYSRPSIGIAGMMAEEVAASGLDYRTGEASFADQGRAVVEGRARGLLRIYGEWATGRILGAEMIGPDAEHHAHLLAWAIGRGLCVPEALGLPVYHPCTEEAVRTALRDLCRNLQLDDLAVERIMPSD